MIDEFPSRRAIITYTVCFIVVAIVFYVLAIITNIHHKSIQTQEDNCDCDCSYDSSWADFIDKYVNYD